MPGKLQISIHLISGRHFYIDLSDEDQDGNWVWKSNGEAAMFLDWDEGEPHGGEYCAAISTNSHDHGRWIDLPCNWKFASPLCEIGNVVLLFVFILFSFLLSCYYFKLLTILIHTDNLQLIQLISTSATL